MPLGTGTYRNRVRVLAAGIAGTLVHRSGARLEMEGRIGVSRVRAGLEGSLTL